MLTFYEKLSGLLNSTTPFVMVTVVDTTGSVPQDAGSKMLVTENGLYAGTVGGGKVEARAIKEAVSLLQSCQVARVSRGSIGSGSEHDGSEQDNSLSESGNEGIALDDTDLSDDSAQDGLIVNRGQGSANSSSSNGRRHNPPSTRFFSWSLSKDIGMTCGGAVRLFMEAFNLSPWRIIIFGAGHLASALIGILKKMDCQIVCYDTRADWIAKLPESKNLRKMLVESLPEQVKDIRAGDSVCLMSMGHSTDMPILLEILNKNLEGSLAYLGVIGSAAKAARLRQDVIEAGLTENKCHSFACPMGLPIGTNHPQEIAISISAQLLQIRDKCLSLQQSGQLQNQRSSLGSHLS
jgi:xanthine dehydrogenase accessory factor